SAARLPLGVTEWEGRIYARIAALPKQAEPMEREWLFSALSVGAEILHFRLTSPQFGADDALEAVFAAIAQGDGHTARLRLARVEDQLASHFEDKTEALRMRARILVLAEALDQQAGFFAAGARV